MNANLSKTTPLLVRLVEAIGKLHFTIKVEVPEGYQDETGFHYAESPRRSKLPGRQRNSRRGAQAATGLLSFH